ncbi:DNA repair ATPase [Actinophytocola xanthii]|uniref:DNA repair ATPase n=1 Tax=Actinophytocola xanthii TaxID=1912961 RepID=A0A1Q8CRE1_9PSEU|nr:DNA repair ATPase [Actinophytocola xanthii]
MPAPAAAAGPVAEASANPGRWGRVDADGTVYVRTEDGERAVGSWQAGEPAEGLAHYARRFDDVRTEVELLEARLTAGSGDPKHTLTNAKHIKESLTDAALVGDLAGLAARVDHVISRAQQAVEQAKHARDEARNQALARKQDLVAEVETIAESSTQWKAAGDRLRAILDEWKTIKGVDRKTDDQLWKRFSKARDTFNRRRGSHFADLDRQRGAAKERKQELVRLAEEISESDDWGGTAARYRELMTEWKAAGRAPKEADDALWQQFRAAQDKFFSRRSAVFSERDAELVENAKRKEALLAEAEKIKPSGDLEAARAQLHRIQERWDEIGKVPRERIRELEGKLRAVEEKVRNAADAQWRKTDPEAEARAAQFRERVEQFEAQAAKARAAGDTRRAEQAEAQAAQWREWLAAAENAVASR